MMQKATQSKYWIIGEVANIPTTKNTTKVELTVQQIGTHQDSLEPVMGKLLCYVEADSLAKQLVYGDKILFQSFVNEVESPKNPQQFDYKQFLKIEKISLFEIYEKQKWLRKEKKRLYLLLLSILNNLRNISCEVQSYSIFSHSNLVQT